MPERSAASAVTWALAAVVVAIALWRLTTSDDAPAGSPVRVKGSPESVERSSERSTRARGLFVHVAGAVRRPGLVELARGARVAEALERAGGPTRRAELAGVNLAAEVEDGQQVIVPIRGPPGAAGLAGSQGAGAVAPPGTPNSGAAPGTPGAAEISLGTATLDQLDELDGIGPTLAERIIEYRTQNGGFGSLQELLEVEGIGEKRFESLSEAVQP